MVETEGTVEFVPIEIQHVLVVYSSIMEEHHNHMRLVFEKLREDQLYVKREKCAFAQQ